MPRQVSVRAEARAVGMRVLMRAAAERAREEAAARERRALAANLPACPLEGALISSNLGSSPILGPRSNAPALPCRLAHQLQGCRLSDLSIWVSMTPGGPSRAYLDRTLHRHAFMAQTGLLRVLLLGVPAD